MEGGSCKVTRRRAQCRGGGGGGGGTNQEIQCSRSHDWMTSENWQGHLEHDSYTNHVQVGIQRTAKLTEPGIHHNMSKNKGARNTMLFLASLVQRLIRRCQEIPEQVIHMLTKVHYCRSATMSQQVLRS